MRVFAEPQFGHSTTSAPNRARRPPPRCGGATPYSRSLRRPSSVIQSVVQAGFSTVRTRPPTMPAFSSATSISNWIMFIAGQPE